ncbi:MAG: hypothetical protein P8R42_20080 [Candidatus Binatia bacterium]|nr:hypothetical protein [Candidatus Binatia bacterium]
MRFPEGLLALVALVGVLASSCASGVRKDDEAARSAEADSLLAGLAADEPRPGELRVRLVFGARADLDLFVTDPAQETVYFANSPSRSGGSLVGDVRCGDPEPRVETVVFPDAGAGRYRVGVDYPKTCDGVDDAAAFVLVVDGEGVSEVRRGTSTPGIFQPIVIEVDWESPEGR